VHRRVLFARISNGAPAPPSRVTGRGDNPFCIVTDAAEGYVLSESRRERYGEQKSERGIPFFFLHPPLAETRATRPSHRPILRVPRAAAISAALRQRGQTATPTESVRARAQSPDFFPIFPPFPLFLFFLFFPPIKRDSIFSSVSLRICVPCTAAPACVLPRFMWSYFSLFPFSARSEGKRERERERESVLARDRWDYFFIFHVGTRQRVGTLLVTLRM